jgi:two-component system response regulator PilR (NtrC family)
MSEVYTALIIDDEADILELISITLKQMQINCITATTVAQAKQALQHEKIHFCLTDMRLPDGDGMDIVKYIAECYPAIPVAVITAYGNIELAVNALKAGAFDFVSKPLNLHGLRDLVNAATQLQQSNTEENLDLNNRLLGNSAAIQQVRQMIAKVARSQAPVLIYGESGTGKELVARLIHEQSGRADKPFVAVNCGAIPRDLMESEFFGYKKGSFTGAVNDKIGLFQAADGGTLLLDEVGELPVFLQVKLLRAIQEKAVKPIGGVQEVPINVRIISATHQHLQELIQHGDFRQDLFYRINVIELQVPPLRERSEDIELLANDILQHQSATLGRKSLHLSEAALVQLQHYEFPGNIRELENILERAATLCEGKIIDVDDLYLPNINEKPQEETVKASLTEFMDTMQKDVLLQALEKNHWNRTATAKQLGITLRALRYRLQKLGLEKE